MSRSRSTTPAVSTILLVLLLAACSDDPFGIGKAVNSLPPLRFSTAASAPALTAVLSGTTWFKDGQGKEWRVGADTRFVGALPVGRVTLQDAYQRTMSFVAESLASIVITDSKAVIQASGAIRGRPGIFTILAVLRDNGSGLVTGARVRITDAAGAVVFDNQPGQPIDSDVVSPRVDSNRLTIVRTVITPQPSTRGWKLCTPNGFSSCHDVSITTVPEMTGTVRTGTTVSITMRNLNGSDSADATTWSALQTVVFYGRTSSVEPNDFPCPTRNPWVCGIKPMLDGDTSVSPVWIAGTGTFAGVGTRHRFVTVQAASITAPGVGLANSLGGCAPVPGGGTTFFTCSAGSSAVITFSSGQAFDAADFGAAYIYTSFAMPNGLTFLASSNFTTCISDQSEYTLPQSLPVPCVVR